MTPRPASGWFSWRFAVMYLRADPILASAGAVGSSHRAPGKRISDEVRRLFYVALTRAREELVLLAPATARAVGST